MKIRVKLVGKLFGLIPINWSASDTLDRLLEWSISWGVLKGVLSVEVES